MSSQALVYFQTAQTHIWDQEWQGYTPGSIPFVMEYYRRFSVIYKTLLRFLPRYGEVPEAGAGLGYWVSLLAETGFQVRGVFNHLMTVLFATRVFSNSTSSKRKSWENW